jgi:hypothetical protein
MNRFLALCSLALLAGVAACNKAEDTPAKGASTTLPDAAKSDADDPDRARSRRPPPATIGGYSNDPANPSGMPGPASSIGTSPNRY